MAYHTPVLLAECIEGLDIKPEGIYIDLTYGSGGHSREILNRLSSGKLFAFDQDKDAEANVIDDKRFLFIRNNFRFFKNFLRYYKIDLVDGILADLGVSSHQLDSADRGFSFRYEGILDMRMNSDSEFTAADLINTYTEKQLYRVFADYGEVRNFRKLTSVIMKKRSEVPVIGMRQFLEVISECIPENNKNKYLARIFQALRIEVNKEIEFLKQMLLQTVNVIKDNGRLVVISYHSLEDRLVKNFIRSGKFEGEIEKDMYGNFLVPFAAVNKKVIVPSSMEIQQNSRARSARLRIARRI